MNNANTHIAPLFNTAKRNRSSRIVTAFSALNISPSDITLSGIIIISIIITVIISLLGLIIIVG